MFWKSKEDKILLMLKVLEIKVAKLENDIELLTLKFRQRAYRKVESDEDVPQQTSKPADPFDDIRSMNKSFK